MTTTAPHTAPEPPSARGMFGEVATLVGFVAQAGPPPFVAAGVLVFGSLMLAGPFAVAVALLVAMALVAAGVVVLVAAVAAIVASPYVLFRQARRYRMSHPFRLVGHRARAAAPVVVRREPVA